MSLTDLRLKRKGQLSDLQAKRKTLAAKADNNLIVIISKADTLPDVAELDTQAILTAAQELDENVTKICELDNTIDQILEELHG